MRRIAVVYNPVSGRSSERSRAIVGSALERAGSRVQWSPTEHGSHATELAAEAVRSGVHALVVHGGDGTIAKAAEGLLGTGVPMGIVPGGTGNQLARNLRIPTDPGAAARTVLGGHVRRIDVGEWERGAERSCFTVACGAGFDAEVMAATTPEKKRRGHIWAYVGQAVRLAKEVRLSTFRITVDGEARDLRASMVLVANCPRVLPPYRPLRRGVALDDGLLDVVAVRATGLLETIGAWSRLAAGIEDPARIDHWSATEVLVEAEPAVPTEYDGDADGSTPFRARILPGALDVLVPERAASASIYM